MCAKILHFSGSGPYEFSDATHWAKLRIKKDKSGNQYADILVGWKGDKKWHAHFGINPNQSIKFEEYRGIINSLAKHVKSVKRGDISSATTIIDPAIKKTRPLVFVFEIKESTGEVVIKRFAFK